MVEHGVRSSSLVAPRHPDLLRAHRDHGAHTVPVRWAGGCSKNRWRFRHLGCGLAANVAIEAERAACPHVGTLSGAEHLGGDAWRPERSSSRVVSAALPLVVTGMSQPGPPPTVFIIDDDADVRVSIAELLQVRIAPGRGVRLGAGVPGPRGGSTSCRQDPERVVSPTAVRNRLSERTPRACLRLVAIRVASTDSSVIARPRIWHSVCCSGAQEDRRAWQSTSALMA